MQHSVFPACNDDDNDTQALLSFQFTHVNGLGKKVLSASSMVDVKREKKEKRTDIIHRKQRHGVGTAGTSRHDVENASRLMERAHTVGDGRDKYHSHYPHAQLQSLPPPLATSTVIFPQMAYLYNPNYPMQLQPFQRASKFKGTYEIGRDVRSYGRLGPLLLTAVLRDSVLKRKNEMVDFKAYCSNLSITEESHIVSPQRGDHLTKSIQQTIQMWIYLCAVDIAKKLSVTATAEHGRERAFRRSIIIDFTTEMIKEGAGDPDLVGHCITLGLEIAPVTEVMTLKIFDYRMHEYVYNVHDQLFKWMTEWVYKYAGQFSASLRTEMVCLKGKIHVDDEFMKCMSVAFRVSLYLARDHDDESDLLHETEDEFAANSLRLQQHILRMFEWAEKHPEIKNRRKTVLIAPHMLMPAFEMNGENCYFLLAPYAIPEHLKPEHTPQTNLRDYDPHYEIQRSYAMALLKDLDTTATHVRYQLLSPGDFSNER
jgi:hypothetical protein